MNFKKIDIEAKILMFIMQLKEEKNKSYSNICDKNIVYVFDNYQDFKAYFTLNGVYEIDCQIIDLCIVFKTTKGTIIALKGLCDHSIRQYKIKNKIGLNEIDEIHKNGKITSLEKAEEFDRVDYEYYHRKELKRTLNKWHEM